MNYAKSHRHCRPFFLLPAMLLSCLLVSGTPSRGLAQDDENMDEFYDSGSMEDEYGNSTDGQKRSNTPWDFYGKDLTSKLGKIDATALLAPNLIEVDENRFVGVAPHPKNREEIKL